MCPRRRRTKFDHLEELEEELRLEAQADGRTPAQRPVHKIDLHGCTQESAIRRLEEGLARCRAGGHKNALVITGRGHGSHGGRAVLAPMVKKWLSGPKGAQFGIFEVRTTKGGGAMEVQIRRSGPE